MIVLLDCDGVISDFTGHVLETAFEITGFLRWREDVTTWSIWEHLGANREELKRIKAEVSQPGWCSSIPPFPGAKDFVEALAAEHELYFVTSPWNSVAWCYERGEWLRNQFGSVLGGRVIHTSHKHLVKGDLIIDDKPKNVREWVRSNPLGMGLLFDQPSNRAGADELIRVRNYREVLSAIDEFGSEVLK